MMRTQRHYPTGLKLQYAAGLLCRKSARHIPRSTRQRWRRLAAQDFYQPAGHQPPDPESAVLMQALIENRRLRVVLALVLRLALIYRELMKQFPLRPHQLLPVIPHIRRCLERSDGPGLRSMLWRLMPCTARQ